MKIVICHPCLPALINRQLYLSLSLSLSALQIRDHLHIYFGSWWRPEFVLQSLTKINSYQVYNTIWSSANLIPSIVLT